LKNVSSPSTLLRARSELKNFTRHYQAPKGGSQSVGRDL
jgi:hypothetical protein